MRRSTGLASGGWSTSGYQPALDGVRALAVLAVLAFHGGVSWLPGGFLGVDVFFVLSGFLITTLLLREWLARGRIDLIAFWGRRARRLLPALLAMLMAVVVISRVMLDPESLSLLRSDALSALFYVANWRMLARGHGGYFAQTASPSMLEHTWSLGIEEQFYLLWPLLLVLLLAVLARGRRLGLPALCLAGAVCSAVEAAALFRPGTDPSRIYYGTDTRAQALLVGSALGALLVGARSGEASTRRWPRPGRAWTGRTAWTGAAWAGAAALAGLAVLAWAVTHASGGSGWLYRGGFLLVALATAAVLAQAVLQPAGLLARVLSLPPLPALGRISYGVYLWHWPIFLALSGDRTGRSGLPLLAIRFAVTLLVAVCSYVLIEQPIRRRRWPIRVALPATATAVCCVAGVALIGTAGVRPPGVVQVQAHEVVRVHAPAPTPDRAARGAAVARPHHRAGTLPVMDFFGDSVAWTVGAYLPSHPGLVTHDHAMQGCGIALGGPYSYIGGLHQPFPSCKYWLSVWQQRLAGDNPDVSVILLDRWELVDRVHDGRWMHVGQPAYDSYLAAQLKTAISIVDAKGAHVVLLTAPYNRRGEQPDGSLYPGDYPSRVDAWNALLRKVAAADPSRVSVVDLGRHVCPAGHFTWTDAGIQVRSDGTHFTPAGVGWLAPWLLPRLAGQVH